MERSREVDANLEFLHTRSDNGGNILYVSCGGLTESIASVKDLVAASPQMHGWHIVAFKQRLEDDAFQTTKDMVVFEDKFRVDPFTAKMKIQPNGNKYDLWIYSPKDRLEYGHKAAYFLLLDLLIGEYEVMTKLAGIDFCLQDASTNQPLVDIRKII